MAIHPAYELWRVVWPVPASRTTEEAGDPALLQRQLQAVAPYAPGYPVMDP